ncbi:hypothetical protein [uncultured Desulfosarcina sp.]|uniref:hypothetical protein n=1 Tax=uncultured Desulfosarcina sp. TaxID=218289 RepID=UPI0029C76242|nr:hypothetical protein [uncultured Desulfosarcina sp.]
MGNYIEKRISPRHPIAGPITLHSTIGTPMNVKATVRNCSEEGICFLSSRKFTTGTTILFKTSNGEYTCACKDRDDCLLRSISFVTVKWCREGQENGLPAYEMGAVYTLPH